jgi:CheY-like chemotaxis protein
MTADAFEEDVQRCLAAGMNDHIAKPVSPELLYQKLVEALTPKS